MCLILMNNLADIIISYRIPSVSSSVGAHKCLDFTEKTF